MFWYGAASPKKSASSVAVIPGDGVGPEVVAAGLMVLDAVQDLDSSVQVSLTHLSWGSRYYRDTGVVMPKDGIEQLANYDAIYFGAVGDPDLPLALPVWGLVLPIRQAFDQYVNLRPVVTVLDGRPVNIFIVRENTEGEYIGQGGRLYAGTPREVALQMSSFSREGIGRVSHYALALARTYGLSCTSVGKANALNYTGVLWDEVFDEISERYPDVTARKVLVDAAACRMVMAPADFEVLVTSNLFGDILSDLGAALVGGLGICPSANFNPAKSGPALFEPVHGSAPDIAGQGRANPVGAILSLAMMLGYLGHSEWEDIVFEAVRRALASAQHRTPDLGGSADTAAVRDAIIRELPKARDSRAATG